MAIYKNENGTLVPYAGDGGSGGGGDNASRGQGYAVCTTEEETTEKTAELPGYMLETGGIVVVKFENAVPANATLNVNSKGAKPIYYNDEAITADVVQAGDTVIMMYDGSCYRLIGVGGWGGVKSVVNITNSTMDMAGQTVTVTIVGGETVTAVFNQDCETSVLLSFAGTYQITCGTAIASVTITEVGGAYTADVISSAWKKWAMVGGAYKSSYGSLADILADEKAIRRLMTIHASVDWLANESKDEELIETIINDDYCAKWVNLRDYALDTLYANEEIKALMDAADKYFYGEWALMPQVPTMTSNTAPYGEVSASSMGDSNTPAWHAFDSSDSTAWGSVDNDYADAWIQYKFTSPVEVKMIYILMHEGSIPTYGQVTISGSNDGSSFNLLHSLNPIRNGNVNINNNNHYLYYRINFKNCTGRPYLYTLQFYAWQPKGNVPVMTSNTAPYGVASASSIYRNDSQFDAWKAFDRKIDLNTDRWVTTDNDINGYIQYKFTNPICVRAISYVQMAIGQGGYINDCSAKIQGSNDGAAWTNIKSISLSSNDKYVEITEKFDNEIYYLYYRFQFAGYNVYATQGGYSYCGLADLQFYGRELKVSETAHPIDGRACIQDGTTYFTEEYGEYDWDPDIPRKYIYDHGVELEGVEFFNGSSAAYVEEKQTDQLYIKNKRASQGTGANMIAIVTSNTIDLTNYNIERCVVGDKIGSDSSIPHPTLSALTSLAVTGSVGECSLSPTSNGNVLPRNGSLDISSLNQAAYPAIVISWSDGTTTCTIKELWLE